MDRERTAAINLRGICKSFSIGERKLEVLREINVSIESGKMTAIMGASGCGKSTLLNIIGCLDVAESGEYWLRGEKITGKSKKQMARIRNELFGYVIQDFALIREDTVWENMKVPLDYSRKEIDKKRIAGILEELGLTKLQKTRVSLLSGGEQQRTAIARALVNDPEIILADEPTGALDSKTGQEVIHILRNICDTGRTVVIVTHDEKIARQCDRILYMKDGQIEADKQAVQN